MPWFMLITAGLLEVAFVITMKFSNGFKHRLFTILTIISAILSLSLLSFALKEIPVGTGYAIWTGIGAAGSVIVGMIFFKEKRSLLKIVFLVCILTGVVGLKLFS